MLRDAEAFFSPCPPTTPSGTLVLVLVSVVAAVVLVNARPVGSVVKPSVRDDVDDLNEVADGLVVRLIVVVAVGLAIDPVKDGLDLDNEVGSVTSVVGSDIDDWVSLEIAVGIEAWWLVLVTDGNVIGPVPESGMARVAVMTV